MSLLMDDQRCEGIHTSKYIKFNSVLILLTVGRQDKTLKSAQIDPNVIELCPGQTFSDLPSCVYLFYCISMQLE